MPRSGPPAWRGAGWAKAKYASVGAPGVRPPVVPLAILALLLAGCATPGATTPPGPAPEAEPRLATAEWKALLSKERFTGVVSSVHRIAAPDGTGLSLTLHLPEGLEEGARVPTLLQVTPYQPLDGRTSTPLTGTDGPQGDWSFYVLRGAAYVEADARGTGGSEGCLDFGGSADRADALAFADWIRAQPWSDGVVVTDGVSHPGMGSVVAHAADARLTFAMTHAPVVSYYRDEWYQGAKFENQFNGPAYEAIETLPSAYLDPDSLRSQAATCRGKTTREFAPVEGPFTKLWDDRDLSRHHEAAAAPILLTQGFIDENVHPDHVQLYWDSLPEDFPKRVVWGWWYHGWPDMEGHPAGDFEDVRHRWLDATLFGLDNGAWAEPRVLVEDSRGAWHEGNEWPLEPSERVTLRPTPEGALVVGPDAAAVAKGEAAYKDPAEARRGEWKDAHVAFRTEPLAEDRLVNGAPVLDLVATSSVPETKWVVWLMDEAPDGGWERVTHGYADSHTWGPEDQWKPLEPGKEHRWRVQLMPTAVVVEKGHRLTLVVTSQDSELASGFVAARCFDDHRGGCYRPSGILKATTAGRATNTVLLGPDATALHLAWVDPDQTAKPPA